MIQISFFKYGNKVIGFEISGHSGYATVGHDIVCAAISSTSQMTANGIIALASDTSINLCDDTGYLLVKLTKPEEDNRKAELLLSSFSLFVDMVKEQYYKFMNVENIQTKEEVRNNGD